MRNVPLSILDLAPVVAGGSPAQSFERMVDLAQHAERWGYNRFWLAEHHSMPGIASSATSLLIGHVAAATSTIRVGSGGIMLPNHAPLVIAEQFGTLETLYPGRIDLGLGRAPGSDQPTMRALRRAGGSDGSDFPLLLEELMLYFKPSEQGPGRVRAVPGEGLNIPVWLLGSSGFSAHLAAQLGLPFSFASHFAPDYLMAALQIYRDNFRPSAVLDKPYAMIGLHAVAADNDEEAARLATSQQQQFLNLIRGRPGKLSPPVDSMEQLWTPEERSVIQRQLGYSIAGGPDTVRRKLDEALQATQADELIITSHIYDHTARLRSYELIAGLAGLQPRG